MCCVVAAILMASPRLGILWMWLTSDRLSESMDSWFLPFIGFFILPWTTLMYAVAWTPNGGVSAVGWFFVVFGFIIDVASYGGGQRANAMRAATVE